MEENEKTLEEEKNDERVDEKVEDHFDYKKAREERIIKSTEKRILKDLGVDSFEFVKQRLKEHENLANELKRQKDNGRKLAVYASGFDDEYIDFVTYDVSKKMKDGEEFDVALEKYKKNHSQYLRENKQKTITTPNFENKPNKYSMNSIMNDFIRGNRR